MHCRLGAWPESIGEAGFPDGLILHAHVAQGARADGTARREARRLREALRRERRRGAQDARGHCRVAQPVSGASGTKEGAPSRARRARPPAIAARCRTGPYSPSARLPRRAVPTPAASPPGGPGSPGYSPSTLSTSRKLRPAARTATSAPDGGSADEKAGCASSRRLPMEPREGR